MRFSTTLKDYSLRAVLLSAIFAAFVSFIPAEAQDNGPQGYCVPPLIAEQYENDPEWYRFYYYCYPDYTDRYYYKDYYGSAIEYIHITASDGSTVLYNYTGPDYVNYNGISRCYNYYADEYEGEGQFVPGDKYYIEWKSQSHTYWYYSYPTNRYCSYYGYNRFTGRLFFDYNKDADYDDPKDDYYPENDGSDEYVLWWYHYTGYGYGNRCANHVFTGEFTVPDDVDPGKTRLRLASQAYTSGPYPGLADRNNACLGGRMYKWWYSYYNGWYGYAYDYGEMEEYLVQFIIPIKATFPDQDDVLYAQRDYDGIAKEVDDVVTQFPRPMVELRDPAQSGTYAKYEIKGPLPSSDVVYTALDADGNEKFDLSKPWNTENPKMFDFYNSKGKFTAGNGEVNFTNSGEYYVELSLWLPGKTDPKLMTKRFTVSFANDLATMDIPNPVKFYTTDEKPYLKKYSRSLNIPMSAVYKNTGKNTVTLFDAIFKIHKAEPVYQNGEIVDYKYDKEVFSETITFDTTKAEYNALVAKAEAEIDFGVFVSDETGIFIVDAYCDLRSGDDEEEFNDRYPRQVFLAGEPNVWPHGNKPLMMFEVADEIESEALASLVPAQGDTMIVNRPFFPVLDVQNNGVSDISDAIATIRYRHKESKTVVHTDQIVVEDIPSGLYNRKSIKFPPAELDKPGEYVGTFVLKSNGDLIKDNDSISWTFYVDHGVAGEFEVGAGKDFTNLTDAIDHLYKYGMEGNVEFILTDAVYDVWAPSEQDPAWDLSTTIIGMGLQEDGSVNSLTIRPSDERMVSRAGTTVRLHSGNGKGIYLGQDLVNNSPNAVVREDLLSDQYRAYYNSPGYITFEGGINKSLKFELYTNSEIHGSVFYLNRGSENITIQNCLLENKTPALKDRVYLPHVKHSDAEGFYFERDSAFIDGADDSYSAGIASRGTLFDLIVVKFDENGEPIDGFEDPEAEVEKRNVFLDTIPNSNNVFRNNEITGFGYGILSTGIGALFNTQEAQYKRYYNKNNVIEGNIIRDAARAGIFVGNEEDITIKDNIIIGVSGNGDGKTAGIQMGTASRGNYKGFNNLRAQVTGNTIYDIKGDEYVNGIRIEQGYVRFVDPSAGFAIFPDEPDNIELHSNAIRDIYAGNEGTDKAGIYALTERIEDKNEYTALINPLFPTLFINNLIIANNTIIMEDDNIANNGLVFGVGIQQAENAVYANNAIAIKDDVAGTATVRAATFLQGTNPNKGFITSDNNALWIEDADIDMVRFVESVPMVIGEELATGFLHEGQNGEYKTLRQWRNWIGMDKNSVAHKDFTQDYALEGDPGKLVIATPTPVSSILNNRGKNLDGTHFDMYGLQRGASDEPYDIGAIEFNSKMYNLDGELVDIVAPGNYRESFGKFAGNEYVMTTSPVEVQARVRNNGSLLQTQLPVTVKIERDDYGTMHKVLEETVYAKLASCKTDIVDFNLADGEGVEFAPETFAELDLPVDDNSFFGMEENVTPVYTITVTSGDDENNVNNVSTKKVRFFVMRSGMEVLECNANLQEDYTNSTNTEVLASNLNKKAIEDGLTAIGYYNVTRIEARDNRDAGLDTDLEYRQDIDRFNRDSWPERALDYTMYRTMIWSDGDNNGLTRYNAMAIKEFLAAGKESKDKKNLIIASEEIVRNNTGLDIDYDFNSEVLFADTKAPHSPMGFDEGLGVYNTYDGKGITGVNVASKWEETIMGTGVANDELPAPGLLTPVDGDGVTRIAFLYDETEDGIGDAVLEDNRIMGLAHVDPHTNILLYAVDWRHFSNPEGMLRASLDFIASAGGIFVPVELYTFDADQAGNRVELTWSTAGENNSSHFEVERRLISADNFAKIGEKEAAGTSSSILHYNMSDNDVVLGNTYAYRLKLVDGDGSYDYSDEVIVELESVTGSMTIGDITPNPVRTSTVVDVMLSNDAELRIELVNSAGQVAQVVYDNFTNAGTHTITIDAAQLAQGNYTVVFRSGQNTMVKTINVVK